LNPSNSSVINNVKATTNIIGLVVFFLYLLNFIIIALNLQVKPMDYVGIYTIIKNIILAYFF